MDASLSGRSQAVMRLARDEAARLHHEYIGTEHILLGIAGQSDGVAAESLKSFGVTLERIRSRVESIIGVGPPTASLDDRGVTPRARQVIIFAQEEAAQHGSPKVEPEHLLLGVAREIHGVAARVLRDLEASPEGIQAKVSGLLGGGVGGGPAA